MQLYLLKSTCKIGCKGNQICYTFVTTYKKYIHTKWRNHEKDL